jgi:undecaprenyl-diphosphatase
MLFLFLNRSIANPIFDAVFPVITNGLFWIIPGVIAAAIFIKLEKKKALIAVFLSLATVGISDPVCNRLIKPTVHRLRPCNPQVHIENGRFLLGRKTSDSFPSSHAMNIFGQAALFGFFYRKKTVWFLLFASIIGFSRIYVGVHYPFDVLCGALFGVCVGAFVYGCFVFFKKKITWLGRLVRNE